MAAVQKRKIRWVISLFLVMLYFSGLPAQAQYGGGTGEPNDPYLIYTAEQMNAIGADANDWDKHFKLMADIDLSAFTGTDFNIIGYYDWPDNKAFTGVFDGNGHTISNFSYTSTDAEHIGLFGYVRRATIKDLGLIDPNVDAGTGSRVGSLVGSLGEGTIIGCYAEGGRVSGDENVGGLVGENWHGRITNCNATGSVTGASWVGGLVGSNRGTITNCYATGDVSGTTSIGGLVGRQGRDGTITNCYATGSVSGVSPVGGLVGDNEAGTITNCYAAGSVTGTRDVGGLVGFNWDGTISNCYATGSVSGTTDVGGLVGDNWGGTISHSFWDIETSGVSWSDGGTGKTTAEMQTERTFTDAGWDFRPHDVWILPVGGGYPILWWQLPAGLGLPSFSGGTGEADDPYLISTAEELNSIGHNPRLMGAHFKLINDIDLAGIDFYIVGSIFPFTGVFDGNGKTISSFSYTSTDANNIGLFGYVRGAEIMDLGLIDPDIDAGTGIVVGSLVGRLREGTISNCYAEGGSVSGHVGVGGLVGFNYRGTITNCYATGSVSGNDYVGGLVGSNYEGTITNCHSSGSVSGDEGVGGLVGRNSCRGYRGGYATITNCYSTGSVSGDRRVGGLVGENGPYSELSSGGMISNCYSTGSVSGTDEVGGLVGSGYYGEVTDSFWDTQTSGQESSAGGTGKTTAEMQMESTFTDAGWDFVGESVNGTEDIWSICEGTNYPRLVWQIPAGDFVCPDGITIEDFVFFIEHWEQETCDLSNDYCDGTDLDFSGTVDEADLEIFVENWLESSELVN